MRQDAGLEAKVTSYWKSWQKAMWRATSMVVAVLALYLLYLHLGAHAIRRYHLLLACNSTHSRV